VPPPPPDPEPITVEDKDRVKAGMLAYWRLVGEACVEAKAIEVEAERNEFLAAKQEAARRAATKPIDELLQRASGKGEEFDRKTHDQALQLIEEAARELH
jgi:hypothetical protein